MTKLKIKLLGLTTALTTLSLSVPTFAAAVDVTTVTTDIGAQAAPVAAIGAAVLILLVGIKAFKWVRKAM